MELERKEGTQASSSGSMEADDDNDDEVASMEQS